MAKNGSYNRFTIPGMSKKNYLAPAKSGTTRPTGPALGASAPKGATKPLKGTGVLPGKIKLPRATPRTPMAAPRRSGSTPISPKKGGVVMPNVGAPKLVQAKSRGKSSLMPQIKKFLNP